MTNQSRISYLNGEFMPLCDAKISAMDRGFLFGDGVYEVIPVYYGKAFRCAQHLERLNRSLNAIYLNLSYSQEKFGSIFEALIKKNEPFDGAYLYLQITRGVNPIRDHALPENPTPTVFASYFPILGPSPNSKTHNGVKAITNEDTRWQNCYIKAITLLPNVLLREEARAQGCIEAILIRNGFALEGTSTNLFIVTEGKLITPPIGPHLLGGITREVVLEIARTNAISCEETDIPERELEKADEVWITSSTKEIQPVVELNGKRVGLGKPGALWKKMNDWYQAFKKRQ